MKFRENILLNYMSMAPLALAFERFMECCILSQFDFRRPILDLGCGDGLFAYLLFDEPIETGIDLNPQELEHAKRFNCYKELIVCPGSAVPKPSGSYQTVFSNSVLEHVTGLDAIFREVNRLLALQGRFYLTVPTPHFEEYTVINTLLSALSLNGLAARYRRFSSTVIWKQQHYHTCDGWLAIAQKSGFHLVDAFTYDSKATCLLNDFLYPFAGMSLINKRIFNRWVLSPNLRRTIMRPLSRVIEKIFRKASRDAQGGLVFLALEKGENS